MAFEQIGSRHDQRHAHTFFVRPAFAKQAVSSVHVAVHTCHHYDDTFGQTIDQVANGAVGGRDVRVVAGQLPPSPVRGNGRHVGRKLDLIRLDSWCAVGHGCIVRRMRGLDAGDDKRWLSLGQEPVARPG